MFPWQRNWKQAADIAHAVIRELNEPLHPMGQADKDRVMRLSELAEEVESCSACYGYLIPALDMLDKEGLFDGFDGKICIGQGYRGQTGELGVGSCTSRIPAQSERLSAYGNRNV